MDRDIFHRVGITSAKDSNKQYMELISDLQVEEARNNDIIQKIKTGLFEFYGNRILKTSSKYRYVKIIQKYFKSTWIS